MKKYLFLLFVLTSALAYGQETSYICGSGSKTLTASATGGTAPITYSWSGPGGTTSGAARVVTVAGTYTWTATDATGCTATGTHVVTYETDPTAGITITASNTCLNTSQTISATGVPVGYSYSWTFDAGSTPSTSTSANPSVQWSTTGSKTITLTITRQLNGSTNGCSATCQWTKTANITVGSLSGISTCG